MVKLLLIGLLFVWAFQLSQAAVSDEGSGSESEEEIISVRRPGGSREENDKDVNEDLLTSSSEECSDGVLTSKQRKMILDTHNDLRSSLAFGKQRNIVGFMSPGRNIYKLTWDCSLEKRVQSHIEECNSNFMNSSELKSNALLIKSFWTYWDGKNPEKNIGKAMKLWWNQGKTQGNIDEKNRYFNKRGYYSWANMAKGKTTRIGCSYQDCGHEGKAVFACLYSEKAQCELEMIYEKGKPCCEDEDCFTFPNSVCLASEGLCYLPQKPRNDHINSICPDNHKMTDAVRIVALEQHNFYRSRIARGLEWNGETNSTQARAKRMTKLDYDCELERYAQDWAENCMFQHSSFRDRPNQGQNLYMTSFTEFEPTVLIRTGIEKWWQELEEFGVPAHNILTSHLWGQKGKEIGHWTQMAWDKTFRIGCSVVNCPQMGFVVCHYGPAGNRKNQFIYEIGDPCTDDSHCPVGFRCLAKLGLCAHNR